MNRKKYIFDFIIPSSLVVIFWLLSFFMSKINSTEPDYVKIRKDLQEKFLLKEKQLYEDVNSFIENPLTETDFWSVYNEFNGSQSKKTEFAFYVFVDSSIIYWSNDNIPINGYETEILNSDQQLIQLPNGFYYCLVLSKNNISVTGLMPVYYNYPYQNIYLKNGFAGHFQLGAPARLSAEKHSESGIVNRNNDTLFSVEKIHSGTKSKIPFAFIFLSFLGALSAFLILILHGLRKLVSKAEYVILLMVIIAIVLRVLQISFHFPAFLYSDPVFSPVYFAWNKWFASLGDLILHVYILFFGGILLWFRFRDSIRYFRNTPRRLAIIISLAFLLLIIFIILNLLLEKLIINSTLLLSFDDILKLKAVDISGFIVIILMVLSFVYISFIFFRIIRKNLKFRNDIILFFSSLVIICCVVVIANHNLLINIFLFLLFVILSVILSRNYFRISGAYGILCLFLFTMSFALVINKKNAEKEKSYRNLYAIQLSSEQDPIGEYLFEEIAAQIKNDSSFIAELSVAKEPQSFSEEYIRRNYLSGYFSKYHLQTTVCKPGDILLIVTSGVEVPCKEFFESMKMQYGTPTMVPDYWLIDDETGRPSYLFETEFIVQSENRIDSLLLFLEMISIPRISGLGYPELLVEEKVLKKAGRFDYTYAKYFNNELITQYGDYYYSLSLDEKMKVNDASFISDEEYVHLVYPINQKTTIVVSLPAKKAFENAATFSYLLIILAVSHFLIFIILTFVIRQPLISMFAFKTRLQTASVFLVILSFIVAGIITVNFFIRYHNNKNREIIREKSYSLLIELEHKLRNYDYLGPDDSDYLSDLMTKFSNVFFTDINLFSTSGRLIATSRPQIYLQGLTSTYINPQALHKLQESSTPYLLQHESIGNLNYTSSYLPFKNYRNEVVAYMNLPYFARENELRKEISSFLITFMNFYVVLIALAIIIALIIANYITLPLRIIGEKLRALKPGQPNEKIQWSKHDDIGVLVGEYNRMVDELADSTRLLMKTERESAWREMAKQIAHEIKNPLTPMKLSLQNLQRAWNDKTPDYDERMQRTSQTLIEQIDALSQIASEFANFARLQEAKLYPVNVISVIRDVIHLYQSDFIQVELNYDNSQSYIVLADDTQLIQIMNNMLKNAVQAFAPREAGEIEVSVENNSGKILISVEDNGCGIPEEIRSKIFSPNFTSKSGGTGLGLAIAKQIADNLGGTISFKSEINKGSIFYICFPEYKEI